MKITDVVAERFRYQSKIAKDIHGYPHPVPEHEAIGCLLRIVTDEGAEGYCFGGDPKAFESVFKPLLVGEDPLYRERIWQTLYKDQRMFSGTMTDANLAIVEQALWDLAGRYFNQPVYKLLGGYRDKVRAYASTQPGDEMVGGLNSPEAYADFAEICQQRGYTAYKMHLWRPPFPGAPDPKMEVAACRAVRERVGDEMELMLDSYHHYTREQSLYIGRELEKLNYAWFEEPMDEYNVSSYIWLSENLEIPVLCPEISRGKMQTRAEWIVRKASDISRGGVHNLGGITPMMKLAHLCEAFGVWLEVHGACPGNLHVLCAMGSAGKYYERGLLHPMIDYEEPPPWLNELMDPMDKEGFVHIPQTPGLGWNINFDYIRKHRVS